MPGWPGRLDDCTATWRSGYAAACKAVYTGSIPVVALPTVLCSVLNLALTVAFAHKSGAFDAATSSPGARGLKIGP
jgi:hypothetical protein